jgi:hypothetical protein
MVGREWGGGVCDLRHWFSCFRRVGWYNAFGTPAWTWDDASGEYYFHSFASGQPDLNWRNPKVQEEVLSVMKVPPPLFSPFRPSSSFVLRARVVLAGAGRGRFSPRRF